MTLVISSHARGHQAESMAAQHLEAHGLSLITRNFRCRQGEIDLIMQNQPAQQLVFVEVKERNSQLFGSASESITFTKQEKIKKTANVFLMQNPQFRTYAMRFDVIAIENNALTWLTNSF